MLAPYPTQNLFKRDNERQCGKPQRTGADYWMFDATPAGDEVCHRRRESSAVRKKRRPPPGESSRRAATPFHLGNRLGLFRFGCSLSPFKFRRAGFAYVEPVQSQRLANYWSRRRGYSFACVARAGCGSLLVPLMQCPRRAKKGEGSAQKIEE